MILEQQQRIDDYNAKGLLDNRCIDECFKQNVANYPTAIALIDPDDREQLTGQPPQQFSYAELDNKVNQLASALLNAGLGKDDVIGLFLPNIWELIVSYLAIARIGAIANPYPPSLREYEISQMGAFADIKAMITINHVKQHSLVDIVRASKANIPSLSHIFASGIGKTDGGIKVEGEHNLDETFNNEVDNKVDNQALEQYLNRLSIDPNEVFSLCWTSGTTGLPKAVPRSHNLWLSVANASVEGANINQQSIFMCPFPIVNMGGIGGGLIPWLHSGCCLVLHQPFELPIFLQQINRHHVTYTLAPPAVLTLLLKNKTLLDNVDISSLQVLGSGSAPLTPWLIKTWHDEYGIQMTNFFGSNEGTCLLGAPNSIPDLEQRATLFPAFGVDNQYDHIKVARGMQSKLVDLQSGETIDTTNTAGELCMKGPTIFTGYYKQVDNDYSVFDEQGFFKSGDVFERIEIEGKRYYRFVERCKDIIIRGGQNIAPADIESLLADMPALAEAAVVGYADEVMGERVALFAVTVEGSTVTLDDIISHLSSKKVAAYKLPEKLIGIDALPRNPVGKILRRELRHLIEA